MTEMKRIAKLLVLAFALTALSACVKVEPSEKSLTNPDMDPDYEFTYGIREFIEYDAKNPGGIDISPYFDFFKTFTLKLYVEGGKISFLEIDNGDLPCDEYNFTLPKGKVACHFDTKVVPNVLRIDSTGDVFATFDRGEFVHKFVLDSEELSYKMTFTTLETTRENYETAY